MKMLEKSVRLGLAALLVGVLAAMGLVAVFLYAQPAEANYPGKPGKIAYTVSDGHDSEIYTIWPGGGGKRQLTHNSTNDGSPVYSPNGKRIAYVSYDGKDYEIYTIKASGGDKHQVTDNSTSDRMPYYSPSGKRIVYAGSDGYDGEIYTIKVDGSDKRQLTHNTVGDYEPAYSPSGKRIAYVGVPDPESGNGEIYTKKVGGGGWRQLTHNSTGDSSPEYGPGGKRIAYTHEDPQSDEEIYTMKTDGSGKFNVTDNNFADNKTTGGDDFGPSYSPSGKKIAYVIYARHDFKIYTTEIFTIKPDGSGKHRVTHSRAEEISPSWGSRP